MSRTIIRGGTVLSMDAAIVGGESVDVLIDGGRIVEVGPKLEVESAEVIDATGMIVMPGFVDSHRHTYQSLVKGVLPACTLSEFMARILGVVVPRVTPEDMDLGNYAGALEALNSGITCMVDWSPSETPQHADGAISGLRRAGIRAMYANGMPGGGPWWYQSTLSHPDDARRIRTEHFSSEDDVLTMALALRQPGNVVDEVAVKDWALAEELDVRVSVHVGMRSEGGAALHPVETLGRLGLLGERTTAIHLTTSSDDELSVIADTGTTVSLAPYVEAIMGHGVPPFVKLMKRGVVPSLSVDTVTTSPGDMFTQMRVAYAAARAQEMPADPAEPFTPSITHLDVLRMATIEGARACGLAERTGSITPGKDADIILIRTDSITALGSTDPAALVVSYSERSDVDTVLVRGTLRKRHGVLTGVDMPKLRADVESAHMRLMEPTSRHVS